MSRSKRPYGFTCPQNRGVSACRSRGVRRSFHVPPLALLLEEAARARGRLVQAGGRVPMTSLLELQRAMKAALLTGSDGIAEAAVVPNGIAPAARLQVYRNNVVGNLTGALKLSFPAVERLVGPDFFAGAAQHFIAVTPPRRANLYDWDDGFAAFLEAFAPAASLAYLADVARLEWAVGRALHAPETRTLDVQALAQLTADQQDTVRFRAHPSVSLLALAHPAHRIWEAVLARDDAALGAIDPGSGSEWLVVHRGAAASVEVLHVPAEAMRFAVALTAGVALSDSVLHGPPTEPHGIEKRIESVTLDVDAT